MSYRFIAHTADIGFEARSKTLEGLFTDAASALMSAIVDLRTVRSDIQYRATISGMDTEDLLVNWLRELLSRYFEFNELYTDFQVSFPDDRSLHASFSGEPVDPARHHIRNEVKAITYSGVRIQKKTGLYRVRIIMDV
jgi:SHS2 domain-containing protein